jgi:MFS family permease
MFEKIKKLPAWNIRNIRIYYALGLLTNLWFIAGNWIFFWIRFMTFGQLGIMDATAFAFGLAMEIPSGAISDLIGKRKTIIWSMGLSLVGTMMMALATDIIHIWVGFFVGQLGWAFYSGAAEALAYDSLVDTGQEKEYENVASAYGTITSISIVFATLVGGLLYTWWFRSTHLFWSLGYLVAFLLSFKLIEPKIDTIKFSFSNYFKQLASGTRQLFKPKLLPFILVILSLMGAGYLYEWGLVKPTMAKEFGFMDKEQAVIFAVMSTIGALAISLMPRIRKVISDKAGLYLLTLIMGIGFVLAFFNLGWWGLLPLFLIGVTGSLSTPWISTVVNDEIDSKYRTTTLSTVALLTKIPYVLLAIIAGSMAENGTFNVFNLGVGVVVIGSVLFGALMLKIRH